MKIYRIKIKNYRNIEHLDWKPNPNVNIIFGENGCGKTNLAVALDQVFSTTAYDQYFDTADYNSGDTSKKIEIEVWLNDVENADSGISTLLQHINFNDELINDDCEEESQKVLCVKLESSDNQKKEWMIMQTTQVSNFDLKFRKAVGYKLIESDRQPLKEINLRYNSLLYKLSEKAIDDELQRVSRSIMRSADEELSASVEINTF